MATRDFDGALRNDGDRRGNEGVERVHHRNGDGPLGERDRNRPRLAQELQPQALGKDGLRRIIRRDGKPEAKKARNGLSERTLADKSELRQNLVEPRAALRRDAAAAIETRAIEEPLLDQQVAERGRKGFVGRRRGCERLCRGKHASNLPTGRSDYV